MPPARTASASQSTGKTMAPVFRRRIGSFFVREDWPDRPAFRRQPAIDRGCGLRCELSRQAAAGPAGAARRPRCRAINRRRYKVLVCQSAAGTAARTRIWTQASPIRPIEAHNNVTKPPAITAKQTPIQTSQPRIKTATSVTPSPLA